MPPFSYASHKGIFTPKNEKKKKIEKKSQCGAFFSFPQWIFVITYRIDNAVV